MAKRKKKVLKRDKPRTPQRKRSSSASMIFMFFSWLPKYIYKKCSEALAFARSSKVSNLVKHDSASAAANIQKDFLQGTNISIPQTQKQRREDMLQHREKYRDKERKVPMKRVSKRSQKAPCQLQDLKPNSCTANSRQSTTNSRQNDRTKQPIPKNEHVKESETAVQQGRQLNRVVQKTGCRAEKPERNSHPAGPGPSAGAKMLLPPKKTVKARTKQARARESSLRSLEIIDLFYELRLACRSCCSEKSGFNKWEYFPVEHECSDNILLLRRWGMEQLNSWHRVRPCPINGSTSNGQCEQNQLGEGCKENPCPYPHNEAEEYVWSKNISVGALVSDLTDSDLLLKRTLRSFIAHLPGEFDIVCKTCTMSNSESLTDNKKTRHKSKCRRGHSMNEGTDNRLMYFFPAEGEAVLIRPEHDATSKVNAMVKHLTSRGFTLKAIIDESKKCAQSANELARNRTSQKLNSGERQNTISQRIQRSTDLDRNQAELPEHAELPLLHFQDIVDTYEVDIEKLSQESLTQADDSREDRDVEAMSGNDTYYEINDAKTLRTLLKSDPGGKQYLHCVIHIEGSQKGKCTTLDGQKVIETRGRMNCGPTFEGDEVLVEVMETPELDKDTKVVRGKVVGVFNRRVNRKAHIFVCTVDPYHSSLMTPLCGTCPKIHVVDSYTHQTYGDDKKNNYVTVYQLRPYLKPIKVVKIDPAKREQLLFVVKYLKWSPNYKYPLGFVCSVMPAGQNMKTGQDLLNLIYQVPGTHAAEVESYVKQGERYGCHFTDSTGREDLTNEVTFSIDPEGCMDVDDALSVSSNSDGTFSVGVHIADVSCFVTDGDVVDKDARKRGSSFYSADSSKSYPMLPTTLSHDLCSLLPGEKRCALSVLFILSGDGRLQKQADIKKTWIRSKGKLTYSDAQKCISEQCDTVGQDICLKVQILHRLTKEMRKNRLGDARFFVESHDLANENEDAHNLIEELMLLTNGEVVKFLIEHFKACVPLRKQDDPRAEDFMRWKEECADAATKSFYFLRLLPDSHSEVESDSNTLLLSEVVQKMDRAVAQKRADEVCHLFGAEAFHPKLAIALSRWFEIQHPAHFVAGGVTEKSSHFSLQLEFYTQFTSPIRRFMDIIVHRMVHACLSDQDNPYTMEDLKVMCAHINTVYERAKRHNNAGEHLQKTCELMKKPAFLPGIVCKVTDKNIQLVFPHLPHQRGRERELYYNNLDVSMKPAITDGTVTLAWQKRIYDARGFHPHAKTKATMHRSVELDTNAGTCRIPADVSEKLKRAIISNQQEDILDLGSELVTRSAMQEQVQELTSEMADGDSIVKHHAAFSRDFKEGSVVSVQMVAECRKGLIQPTIRLLKFTDEYTMCVQHMKNPVSCFAKTATNHLKDSYRSIEDYQKILMPVLQIEAASNSVADSDPVVISNAQISLRQSNCKFYGRLELPMSYCKPRCIPVPQKSKDEDSDFCEFLCLRCPFRDADGQRQMWVGHAVQTNTSTTEEDDVFVEFGVHFMNEKPPLSMTTGRSICHIELLAKTLPDKRMEDALKKLPHSSELCKAIALGHNTPAKQEGWKKLCSLDLDIKVDSQCPPLPPNNERQNFALRTALTERFTLIQGPPGTGKTITGIKLAYWYCKMNSKQAVKSSAPRRQVLYCGPSNSAVDVAADMLQKRLGSECPKILRVYSGTLQNQDFPIPRDVNTASKRDRNYQMLGKEGQKSVVLHYLIRQETNRYHNRIRAYDKRFRELKERPEEVTDEEIDDYKQLIKEASMAEIKKYDVILCTCAVSASPCVVRAANVTQVIIDECGMCMEPESLVPLEAHRNVEQVTLVGDHRQLRPIVKNATARELGLEKSLFERYGDNAILLNEQYRMHNEICAFPSAHFYNSELRSPLPESYVTPSMIVDRQGRNGFRYTKEVNIWPNKKIPLVFCHVEGAEKTLSVSTDEGNENSKSNEAEMEHATHVYRELVNNYEVPPEKITILTQYKAQCSEIVDTLKGYGYETPRVSTVVASQGGEWDYVILSTVRSLPTYEIDKRPSKAWLKMNLGFITDSNQINVALTRAIKGLIIIGNKKLLRCDPMWCKLLEYYRAKRCLVSADAFLRERDRGEYHRNLQKEAMRNQRNPSKRPR